MTDDMPYTLPAEVQPACSSCGGTGQIQVTVFSGNTSSPSTEQCTVCQGSGKG